MFLLGGHRARDGCQKLPNALFRQGRFPASDRPSGSHPWLAAQVARVVARNTSGLLPLRVAPPSLRNSPARFRLPKRTRGRSED